MFRPSSGCHSFWYPDLLDARSIAMDYSRPYSSSLDRANYLRPVGATRDATCGADFHGVGLQPYFRRACSRTGPRRSRFWRSREQSQQSALCLCGMGGRSNLLQHGHRPAGLLPAGSLLAFYGFHPGTLVPRMDVLRGGRSRADRLRKFIGEHRDAAGS